MASVGSGDAQAALSLQWAYMAEARAHDTSHQLLAEDITHSEKKK